MKNIFLIFKNDVMKIHKNVIAMIVIMGITVIPTLYAWFNISASWDPYGNTGELKLAVASDDKGYNGELIAVKINMGDQILSSLHKNKQFNWVFTDSKTAQKGVKSGKYYAAIVIPKDFSQKMMSVFSSNTEHPDLTYYQNEKENAIAPIITGKGATAVQKQINETFIETVAQTALDAFQIVSSAAQEVGDDSMVDHLIDNLNQMGTDLGSVAGTVQSLSDMTDSAITMLNTTTEFLQESGSGTKSSVSSLENSDLSSLTSLVSGTSKTISDALTQNASFYTAVSDAVDKALDSYNSDAQAASNALTSVSSRVQTVIDEYTKLSDALTAIANEHPELTILNNAVTSINQKIQLAIDRQTAIRDKINAAAEALPTATANAAELKSELDALIAQATSSVTEVKTTYENNVKGNLDSLSANLDSTTGSISSMLGDLDKSIQNIAGVTGSASNGLTGLQKTLSNSAELLNEASEKLTSLAATLSSEDSKDLSAVTNLLSEDPETIASFLSSPVKLDEKKIYPIENYGSAMTPFYSTLAIWVGAVVMAAMLKVTVADSTKKILFHPKEYQLYIGRILLLIIIGFMQSALICLGDLFFLGIQCKHPVMFVLTGMFTSFVYVNLIYALTVSFGDIGKAIAVVLMVMQVAGSGGTFPIQCAPKFFQVVYPLLPFTHSMNAMRECIAGFYGTTYAAEIGKLAIYLVPSLLLGLLLRKPIIKMNDAFMEKLESTHLI
ncbi:MAG: YhgE/Pip domain-containing protein [[Ruminococcus] faecis]|nr:YhgE/Pip domain-containing protein [Mediterraneibacter faecis]